MDQEELRGGVNGVTRTGGTVRRPTGHWTPNVHALLRHLRAAGFTGAPAVHGLTADGRGHDLFGATLLRSAPR